MKAQVTLGIDIGGTNTALGLVDAEGHCFHEESFSTLAQEPFSSFFSRLSGKIDALLQHFAHEYVLEGIGAAAPAGNYYRGTIDAPSNLKWGTVDFVHLMKDRYKIPVAITNDANAAALGEMIYGEAKGMRDFIVITLGTGLGSGIVVNGNVIYGHDGLAGELGHTVIEPGGRQCYCGRYGCLETYVSSRGICRTVFELLAQRTEVSELRQISFNELTAVKIYECALRQDPLALAAFEYTGRILGRALADTVAYFSPEAIIIFGGLAKAGELLLAPTRRHFENNLLEVFKGKVKIIPSGVTQCNIAVLGASVLIQKEIEKMNRAV
ncbi:MAG: ROK family protein [candidate division KSB1 bacterium]|nr:ROK family protein [candidate division KSB1 bacterium]MDZ7302874.1 ROK family protein [candidate division KSB1 bacterium]MDZ7310450.1 ROK family protein [candidate division KSB1 bacterium]